MYLSNVDHTVLLRNCLSKHILRGQPIPMAERWVCGRLLAGAVGSNPGGGMDISLF